MNDYPPAALDRDVKRYLELDELAKDIASEQAGIKAQLRSLGEGNWEAPCGVQVLVTPQRRFNPEHAQTVIPADLLPLVQSTVIDSKKVRALLPPALYEACQVESGDLKVTIR